MPTIHREAGFLVIVRTNDHPPPHVHVKGADAEAEALIDLGTEETPPFIREIRGMRTPDVRRAVDIIRQRRALCLAAWEKYHGT